MALAYVDMSSVIEAQVTGDRRKHTQTHIICIYLMMMMMMYMAAQRLRFGQRVHDAARHNHDGIYHDMLVHENAYSVTNDAMHPSKMCAHWRCRELIAVSSDT